MGVRLVWLLLVAACGFHPAGGEGEDAPPPDGDSIDADDVDPTDAADIDAPIDAAIDAPIDAPPAACPPTYNIVTETGRYAFRPVAMNHGLAQADCNDDAAGRTHLATFEQAGDFDDDLAAINPGNSAIPFIGASCGALDCNDKTNWMWNTGVRVDESLWVGNEPNNGLTERIAAAVRDSGEWKMQSMAAALETRPYICECD